MEGMHKLEAAYPPEYLQGIKDGISDQITLTVNNIKKVMPEYLSVRRELLQNLELDPTKPFMVGNRQDGWTYSEKFIRKLEDY